MSAASDNMPGSPARRKRDNSFVSDIGIRFSAVLDGMRRAGKGVEGAHMPAFEWNKIIASVLTAMIVAMVAGILANMLVHPQPLENHAYVPPGAEGGAAPAAPATAPAGPPPIAPFMAKADATRGQKVAQVCLQCHTFNKGEPNKIGPNLFGVVAGENIASVAGYTFSPALLKFKDKKWDPDELNVWLFQPQQFAPGTKMTFVGLPKEQDRADVIAYLETLK
jgi:cytochrome c